MPTGSTSDTAAHVILAHFRILVPLLWGRRGCVEVLRPTAWGCAYVTGGFGVVSRGGDYWSNSGIRASSSLMGELGVGYRLPIAPTQALRIEVEELLYHADVRQAAGFDHSYVGTDTKSQHDFQVIIGLVVTLKPRCGRMC